LNEKAIECTGLTGKERNYTRQGTAQSTFKETKKRRRGKYLYVLENVCNFKKGSSWEVQADGPSRKKT